jgi:hypothetical protein
VPHQCFRCSLLFWQQKKSYKLNKGRREQEVERNSSRCAWELLAFSNIYYILKSVIAMCTYIMVVKIYKIKCKQRQFSSFYKQKKYVKLTILKLKKWIDLLIIVYTLL